MNIIFLDVDHVLNSTRKLIEVYKKTHKSHSGYSYPFDEICMENLRILVLNTNSRLVITSVWRKEQEGKTILLNELGKYDLDKYVIGYTPILNGKSRGEEIASFLSKLQCEANFVILDDDSDMGELLPFLIKTDGKVGLTYENVKEAIIKLKQD